MLMDRRDGLSVAHACEIWDGLVIGTFSISNTTVFNYIDYPIGWAHYGHPTNALVVELCSPSVNH